MFTQDTSRWHRSPAGTSQVLRGNSTTTTSFRRRPVSGTMAGLAASIYPHPQVSCTHYGLQRQLAWQSLYFVIPGSVADTLRWMESHKL